MWKSRKTLLPSGYFLHSNVENYVESVDKTAVFSLERVCKTSNGTKIIIIESKLTVLK